MVAFQGRLHSPRETTLAAYEKKPLVRSARKMGGAAAPCHDLVLLAFMSVH
jgi:hypothetical protein